MHEISIAAEKITEFSGYAITNSLITTVIVSLLIIIAAVLYSQKASYIPSKLQSLFEMPMEFMHNLSMQIAPENGREFFPLITTIFIFILVSNWFALLPGVTGFGVVHHVEEAHAVDVVETYLEEELVIEENLAHVDDVVEHSEESAIVPIIRATTADLNTTIALALIAMVSVHYYGFKHLGVKLHLGKYFNFSNPINGFVGLLEFVGEFSKVISFAFRLFGNIFAGEVLLIVMGLIIPSIFPKIFPGIEVIAGIIQFPFLGLELFVGFIQALVFAMLTLVFCNVATQHH